MLSNRSRTEIISDLIEASRSGAKKTHLMYRGNLSYQVLSQYLEYMMSADLIREDNSSGERLYFATAKGLRFLDLERELSTIASFNDQPKRTIGVLHGSNNIVTASGAAAGASYGFQPETKSKPVFNW
jgi:predicted transcriptional regulator